MNNDVNILFDFLRPICQATGWSIQKLEDDTLRCNLPGEDPKTAIKSLSFVSIQAQSTNQLDNCNVLAIFNVFDLVHNSHVLQTFCRCVASYCEGHSNYLISGMWDWFHSVDELLGVVEESLEDLILEGLITENSLVPVIKRTNSKKETTSVCLRVPMQIADNGIWFQDLFIGKPLVGKNLFYVGHSSWYGGSDSNTFMPGTGSSSSMFLTDNSGHTKGSLLLGQIRAVIADLSP